MKIGSLQKGEAENRKEKTKRENYDDFCCNL